MGPERETPDRLLPGASNGVGATAFPMSIAEAYSRILFHGPRFQGIEAIRSFDMSGATGLLRPSDPRECLASAKGDWLLDPILVDSAFQMVVLWSRLNWDVTVLPSAVQTAVPLSPFSNHPLVRCDMVVRTETNFPVVHTDFFFYGPNDELCGVVMGLESNGSKELNRLAEAFSRV
jgi:hypothetical protein